MSVKKILSVPDRILKEVSVPCINFDQKLHDLINDIRQSMEASKRPGIGLAAIQIGIPKRVLIADVFNNECGAGVVEMINPIILSGNGRAICEEGCLSVPEFFIEVERFNNIVVEYYNRYGKKIISEYSGICSTVVQHEIDHLDGHTILDYVSDLKRGMMLKKIAKYKLS